jgi:hypothetical protein
LSANTIANISKHAIECKMKNIVKKSVSINVENWFHCGIRDQSICLEPIHKHAPETSYDPGAKTRPLGNRQKKNQRRIEKTIKQQWPVTYGPL